MLFNSIEYILFLPVVAILYLIVFRSGGRLLLLAASYLFYSGWNPAYLLLIVISTITDFFVGVRLEKAKSKAARAGLLGVSLVVNLGLLGLFKYADFFISSLNKFFSAVGVGLEVGTLGLILPVGISFYTFQTLGYTIDIFRGKQKAEKSLLTFALYVAYFPQLVAGPIERASNLLPQLKQKAVFYWPRIASGLKLIIWGMFQKVVVADGLAVYVNRVFENVDKYGWLTLVIAVVFFGYQIYLDFAGYSNIAIGSARILGVNLMTNFNVPYLTSSLRDFWRNWHISLSTWFRDYLYKPLGGSRKGELRTLLNLFIVFTVSGLWHGANWTFVIWGALHGGFLVLERIVGKFFRITKSMPFLLEVFLVGFRWLITFTFVQFAWIFFRSGGLGQATLVISRILGFEDGLGITEPYRSFYKSNGLEHLMLSVILIISIEFFGWIRLRRPLLAKKLYNRVPILLRVVSIVVVILIILLLGVFSNQEFIYFQF